MSRLRDALSALVGRSDSAAVQHVSYGISEGTRKLREADDTLTKLIAEDRDWRRLGDLEPTSELSPRVVEVELQLAQHFAENSPIGKKLVDAIAAHIIGAQLTFDTDNAQLDTLLKSFWDDPENGMDSYLPKLCREWLTFGEVFLPIFVSEQQGLMRLGYLHPRNVKSVATDPDNTRTFTTVTEKRPDNSERVWRVVNGAVTADMVAEGGNWLLYYPLQWRAVGRGRPVLAPAFYWIQKAERWLSERMIRAEFLNAWSWDLELTNASKDAVLEQRNEIADKGMPHGGVYVHNDAAKLTAISPPLGASDAIDDFHAILKYIGHAASLPAHWMGAEADVNRTTAESSSSPTIKFLENIQAEFGAVVLHMLNLQRELFRTNGTWSGSDEEGLITLTLPDLTPQNNDLMANATAKIVNASIAAVRSGLLDITTARRLVYQVTQMPMPDNIEELIDEQRRDDAVSGMYAVLPPPPTDSVAAATIKAGEQD